MRRLLILTMTLVALLASGCVTANVLPDGRILLISATGTKLFDPATGTVSLTGSPSVPRAGHASAVLNDGKVLVTGGAIGSQPLSAAEIWDPTTGAFSPTGDMTEPRGFHTATTLDNGKVLITGGGVISQSGGEAVPPTVSAELFDPASGTFTKTGDMALGRALHTAVKLDDGRVLIVGGGTADASGATPTSMPAEIYDPNAGTFSAAGVQDPVATLGTVTKLADGKVLVAGGYHGSDMSDPDALLATTQVWDPATLAFTPGGALTAGRAFHSATLLADGKVLIAGGLASGGSSYLTSAEIYDPATGTSTATGDMATARAGQVAARLPDGHVLVTGGDLTIGMTTITDLMGNAEIYDPSSGTWSAVEVAAQPSPTPGPYSATPAPTF
jgi:hypothetical protein